MKVADYIKQHVTILQVVQTYLQLEKKSEKNWTGLCPFHSEKTPSFSVNPRNSMYRCFGCQKSGDLIKFVQEMEQCGFIDACRKIVEQHSIPAPIRVHNRTVRAQIAELEQAGRRKEAIELIDSLRRTA